MQAQPDPIINNGLPGSFSFYLNNIDGSQSFLEPKAGATVFYARGLIGWKYQGGRVISFSTLLSKVELTDPNYARLFGNAVEWAADVHWKQIDFTMRDRGGVSFQTSGRPGTASLGYAAIQPSDGSTD